MKALLSNARMSVVFLLAVAGITPVASAQLYSVYAPGASNPNAWFHDVTTGALVDLNEPGADAFATDEASRRVYFLAENVLGPDGQLRFQQFAADGNLVSTSSIGVPMTPAGQELSRAESLAFGDGVLYTHNRQISNDAPTGLYELSLTDATATLLFNPTFGGEAIIIQGLAFNEDNALLYAAAFDDTTLRSASIYSIDPQTQSVSRLVPDIGGNVDGLAYGDGRLYLVSPTGGAIRVYNLVTERFEEPFANARRFEQGPGGATFAEFLRGPQTPAGRSVQMRSVDFDAGIIELFNFDRADVELNGWRFCSHDFNEQRRYTAASGFAGVTIESNTALFVHFNDDAPAGDPDRINRSALGGAFATPLDQDAYALQLFFPDVNGTVSFGNSTLIADHLQWNIDGQGVGSTESRTAQAVGESLWSATGDFVSTQANSAAIRLIDLSGDFPGSPAEYDVVDATAGGCGPADVTTEGSPNGVPDGAVTLSDFSFYLTLWSASDTAADLTSEGTANGVPDGVVTLSDFSFYLSLWSAGCP